MSMELQDISVRSKNDPIWRLEDFHFSGATILFKSAAAYTQTSLAAGAIKQLSAEWGKLVMAEIGRLAAAAANVRTKREGRMKEKNKEKTASSDGQGKLLVQAIAAGVGPALSKAIEESLTPFVGILKKQQQSIERIAASVEETKALSMEAAKHEDEDEDDMEAASHEDDDDMEAAKHEDDDEEDMDAAGKKGKKADEEDDDEEDDSDDEDLDAEMEHLEDDPADDEPGEINKEAKNMGDKTTRTGKIGKSKKMAELSSARSIQASSVIRELYASHRALRKKYRTIKAQAAETKEAFENKIEALEAQLEQYADRVDRKSVSAELSNFLGKNNVDVRELRAEGKKLSVSEVDQIFANAPVELDPTTRMWFKNQLLEAELMDQGEIHRGM